MRCKSPNPNQEMILEMKLLYRRKSNNCDTKAITILLFNWLSQPRLSITFNRKSIFITPHQQVMIYQL